MNGAWMNLIPFIFLETDYFLGNSQSVFKEKEKAWNTLHVNTTLVR